MISILELEEPKFVVSFHLIPKLSAEAVAVLSPLSPPPLEMQRQLADDALREAKHLGASEAFVLKNLEKDGE
jgi:hypothetical protein